MQPIRSINSLIAALCLLVTSSAMTAEYSGIWWDSGKPGQGVSIHHEGSLLFGAWYLYDTSSQAMWLTIENGTLNGNSVTADLFEPRIRS